MGPLCCWVGKCLIPGGWSVMGKSCFRSAGMRIKVFHILGLAVAVANATSAAVVTVTTTNNESPGPGEMSLVMALTNAQAGDTIAFNIPGEGPHYIETPVFGYPFITQNNLTIDGYTQPGAAPNTNSIHAPNSAVLKVVLDSRTGGRTVMNYGTGRPGYADYENAILGVFNSHDVTIKGLCFLGLHTSNSDFDPSIYCIAFARDHSGAPDYDNNGHVAGCWFGVEPDGTSVTGGSAAGITAFRHRDVSGGMLPELPNRNLTVGVKAGSTNARAEFNVIVAQGYHVTGEQIGARVSGNFMGVLPDGMTPYDITVENPGAFGGATIEIGRYNNSTNLVGTDGDGINDAEEGNVFGPLSGGNRVVGFFTTGNKRFIIAGNYFGVAVDGVTRFPGSFQILGMHFDGAKTRFGSDFDGVSDDLEANLVMNNHPFENPIVINPITARPGAIMSVRGNRFVNNFPLPVNVAGAAFSLADPDPATFYLAHLMTTNPLVIQPVITEAGTYLVGTTPIPKAIYTATIIDLYEADPEGMTNGMTLAMPELPNGFVQGREYIASFVDNSLADLDPAPGAFRFDISALSIVGKTVTITANYSVEPPGTHNATVVTSPFSEPMVVSLVLKASIVRNADNTVTLTWPAQLTGVAVESTRSLTEPDWQPVSGVGAGTVTVPVLADGDEFFRLKQ